MGGFLGPLFEQLGIEPRFLLINAISFLILLWLLGKFLYGPINQLLQERQEYVRRQREEAERYREEMQQLRDDYEQRIAHIEREARERIQEAVRQAHVARDQLLAEARAEAESLRERALADIEHEKQKALVEIRDQVVDLALLAAGKIIERELDARAHRAMIENLLERVGHH